MENKLKREELMKLFNQIFLLTLIILSTGCLRNSILDDKILLFEQDGLWGYTTKNKKIIIKPKYIMAHEFSKEGIAAVLSPDKGWIYIDKYENEIIKPYIVDNGFDEFSEGLARYEDNGKIGFFNEKGQKVIEARFEYASQFKHGMAAVGKNIKRKKVGEIEFFIGGNWGFINHKGELFIPYKFDNIISSFDREGKAIVVYRGVKVYMNKDGKIIERVK